MAGLDRKIGHIFNEGLVIMTRPMNPDGVAAPLAAGADAEARPAEVPMRGVVAPMLNPPPPIHQALAAPNVRARPVPALMPNYRMDRNIETVTAVLCAIGGCLIPLLSFFQVSSFLPQEILSREMNPFGPEIVWSRRVSARS